MKITKRYWIIPTLSAIAAILAVLLAGCGNKKSDNQAINEQLNSSDSITASQESKSDGGSAVVEFTKDMTLNMNPEKPIVIDFNATWCPPCQKFKPIFHSVAEKYADKATFYSVDVDNNPELAAKFQVEGIPMMVVIRPDGKVDTTTGFMSQDEFEKFLKL